MHISEDHKRISIERLLFIIAALFLIIAGLKWASQIVVPFLLSVFIAIVSMKPLNYLKSKGVPTIISFLTILLFLLVISALSIALLGNSIGDFMNTLPEYEESLQEQRVALFAWLGKFGVDFSGEDKLYKAIDPSIALNLIGELLNGLKKVIANGLLILLMVAFILMEATNFHSKAHLIFADPDKSLDKFNNFNKKIQTYMSIKTYVSIATGITIAIWLLILKVDFPFLWGFLAFLLNYIPTIGSILAVIPVLLLTLVTQGAIPSVLVFSGYLFVNFFFGTILEPKITGKGVGISALTVFLSLVFWGWVFGPVGMLLAVPLTISVKLVLESNEETRALALFLGSGDSLQDTEDIEKDC